jgi:hypothetical protein
VPDDTVIPCGFARAGEANRLISNPARRSQTGCLSQSVLAFREALKLEQVFIQPRHIVRAIALV